MGLAVLTVVIPHASAASAASADPCTDWLAHTADLAAARGYVLTTSAAGLTGTDEAQSTLQASCADDRAALVFTAPDATQVHVQWTAAALELRGEFPDAGRVTQTWTDDTRSLHTAEAGAAAATVEFDPATGNWSADGDPDDLNALFEPVLGASTIWADANYLVHALTGVWDSGLERDEDALYTALSLALPPMAAHDVDKGGLKKDCGATIGICAVAYFWKPLTGACIAAGAKCLAAFKCWKSDCSGDGKS